MPRPFVLAFFSTAALFLYPAFCKAQATPDVAPLSKKVADLEDKFARDEKALLDWPNLARYREANARLVPPAAGEQRVVFMGDSITDMWVLPRFGEFFPGKPYIGRGISGQTTPQMLIRFRPDVLALQPQVVVFWLEPTTLPGIPVR
jgi:hypothetical protein